LKNFKKGQHLEPGETKALILWHVLEGCTNETELKAVIRREASLKNNRDVIYHLYDKRYGLVHEGIIKRRKNKIEISTRDVSSLTKLCFLLFSNHGIALQLLPSFDVMRYLSRLFILDKHIFVHRVRQYVEYHEVVSKDVQRFNDGGEDPEEIFPVCRSPEELHENIRVILHAIKSNLVIDSFVEKGITDPPYEFHGEFFAPALAGMEKTGGFELGYFPIADSELEKRAINEFLNGILKRSANHEVPYLSMLTLSPEKERLIALIDRVDMKLNSLRNRTASEIVSLVNTENRR